MRYQDLRTDPARSINSGKIESSPGDFRGFKCLSAFTSSSGMKGPVGHLAFHTLGTLLLTSLVGSQSLVLCATFFINCKAMVFAEMGHRWEECLELAVSLLTVFHALRLSAKSRVELAPFPNAPESGRAAKEETKNLLSSCK